MLVFPGDQRGLYQVVKPSVVPQVLDTRAPCKDVCRDQLTSRRSKQPSPFQLLLILTPNWLFILTIFCTDQHWSNTCKLEQHPCKDVYQRQTSQKQSECQTGLGIMPNPAAQVNQMSFFPLLNLQKQWEFQTFVLCSVGMLKDSSIGLWLWLYSPAFTSYMGWKSSCW